MMSLVKPIIKSDHPLRLVYTHMMSRCYNREDKNYCRYGERGIRVCDDWVYDKNSFFKWALPLWCSKLQLDRIDNDGNYEPDNCRFTTSKENIRNSTIFIYIEKRKEIVSEYLQGKTVSQISRSQNVSRPTIYSILAEENIYRPQHSTLQLMIDKQTEKEGK